MSYGNGAKDARVALGVLLSMTRTKEQVLVSPDWVLARDQTVVLRDDEYQACRVVSYANGAAVFAGRPIVHAYNAVGMTLPAMGFIIGPDQFLPGFMKRLRQASDAVFGEQLPFHGELMGNGFRASDTYVLGCVEVLQEFPDYSFARVCCQTGLRKF